MILIPIFLVDCLMKLFPPSCFYTVAFENIHPQIKDVFYVKFTEVEGPRSLWSINTIRINPSN